MEKNLKKKKQNNTKKKKKKNVVSIDTSLGKKTARARALCALNFPVSRCCSRGYMTSTRSVLARA